jgi:hypothetical protein
MKEDIDLELWVLTFSIGNDEITDIAVSHFL